MDLWLIFLTGLTSGGISCLAVQGGLLASTVATGNPLSRIYPVLAFLAARLVAYIILGFGLGLLGQAITLTDQVKWALQLIVGGYLIIIALGLLGVIKLHSIHIPTPKFLTNQIKSNFQKKTT